MVSGDIERTAQCGGLHAPFDALRASVSETLKAAKQACFCAPSTSDPVDLAKSDVLCTYCENASRQV